MRGSQQGRRLLGGCLLGGAGIGGLCAAGAAYVYAHDAPLQPCGPYDMQLCKRLEIAGFSLHSSRHAAAVVGPIMAFLAFLVIVVVVLYTAEPQNRHS